MLNHKIKSLLVAMSFSSTFSFGAMASIDVSKDMQIEVMKYSSRSAYTATELGLENAEKIAIEIVSKDQQRVGLIHLDNPLYSHFEEFDEQTGEFISHQDQWFEKGALRLNAAQKAILQKALLEEEGMLRIYSLNKYGAVIELSIKNKQIPRAKTRSINTSAFKLIDNGSPDEKIDIVLLGDGYTANEKEKFREDAKLITDGFFAKSPYYDYKNYFNVWLIDKASQQSGVGIGSPLEGSAFRSYFPDSSSRMLILKERYLSLGEASAVLPESAKEIFVVVTNTDKYGGVGYSNIATMSTHSSAVNIALHEVGHIYGKLADEYSYGNCSLNSEPSAKNVTMDTSNLKWAHWLEHDPEVGAFEGAQYCSTGKYRPTSNSLMRALGGNLEFGPVNTEALILKMYETITPLKSAKPSAQSVQIEGNQSFSIVSQVPNDRLSVVWTLDGKVLSSGKQTSVSIDSNTLKEGSYTLEVIVKDTTKQVKRDLSSRLVSKRQWQLNVNNGNQTEMGYRYVRFVADSEIKGQSFASAAELNFIDRYGSLVPTEQLSIVSVSSEEITYSGQAQRAIDGDPNTIWHSQWSQSSSVKPPHEIVIDLGRKVELSQMNYLPRQDGNVNGTIKDYRLYLSNNMDKWSSPITTGKLDSNTEEKSIVLDAPQDVNQAPNAIVTSEQYEFQGAKSFTLMGETSNDPDGDRVVYQWQQISPAIPLAMIESPTEANTLVNLPESTSDTVYLFSLTVSDGELSDSAEISIIQKSNMPLSAPEWESGKTYASPCQRVSWNGFEWDNQWWTQGSTPDADGQWGVWRKVASNQSNQCE